MIGGADKYMATCRSCFFAPVIVPASPRVPLKKLNETKENMPNGFNTDEDTIPHKRALFDNEHAVENSM